MSAETDAAAAAALAVVEAYMTAFNAQDLEAFTAQIHFPHVSFGPGAPVVTPEGGVIPAFHAVGPGSDWSHSTLEQARVIQADADKVHLTCRVTRHRLGGGIIGTYDVLYVIARENGRWGMKALSGLRAPAQG